MTMPESLARRILQQALLEHRCAEFLECLFDGGSATVDLKTGHLILASGEAIGDLKDIQ